MKPLEYRLNKGCRGLLLTNLKRFACTQIYDR